MILDLHCNREGAFHVALVVKNPPPSAGDIGDITQGSIPGLGRCSGGRQSNPLQYSCLENPLKEDLIQNITLNIWDF